MKVMARGILRIYLGAAPGVGKTFAMLCEGARRQARGIDVVVGLCETHDRPKTSALLEGMEVIPRRAISYRGTELLDMDLDAILARRPQLVLVDELAHSNVPGCRHEKRWQDIDELLDAGIDVISTVNIQHLESLNDAVEAITGIVQRETVPDDVVRAADQIELVDMSPEALRRRMAHGNIYKAAKVDAALSNYFRVGNLAALRELALLWLADRVQESVGKYRTDHAISSSWPTRERIVVALSGGPEGETLLRRGARIAVRGAGGEMMAVYVARTDGLTNVGLDSISRNRRLTEELGGSFHTVTGDETGQAILEFAQAVNASQIIVGVSRRPRWRRLFSPGLVDEIITESGDIDVHVINHSYAGRARLPRRQMGFPLGRMIRGFIVSLLGITATTLAIEYGSHGGLGGGPGLPLIVQIYLLWTVLAALIGGVWPAVFAAIVSSLTINWFFTPPLQTLTISNPENTGALLLFVATAAAVAVVVHLHVRRAAQAVAAGQESAALAELTHTLLGSTQQIPLLLERAVDMFGVDGAAIVTHKTLRGECPKIIACTSGFDPACQEYNAVAATEDGRHDLVLTGPALPASDQRLFEAYATHAGAILQRHALQREAKTAQALSDDNRARTALLSAVSHDLRTPLAGIKAAIGSLRSTQVQFTDAEQEELKAAIEDSADRLGLLIGNLLDMSRLQMGALVSKVRQTDLGEVIPPAVAALPEPGRVSWSLGTDARYAQADAGLLDRVLGNLLENAVRFQPADDVVRVTTALLDDTVQIRVIDTGKGISPGHEARVFQPFQRYGDNSTEGIGLGLAVARGLTEAMGGSLEHEDTPGGGLTMIVSLPKHAPVGGEND